MAHLLKRHVDKTGRMASSLLYCAVLFQASATCRAPDSRSASTSRDSFITSRAPSPDCLRASCHLDVSQAASV